VVVDSFFFFFSHRVRARARQLGFPGSLGKVVGGGRFRTLRVQWWDVGWWRSLLIPFLFFSRRVRARAKQLGFPGSLATHVSPGTVASGGRFTLCVCNGGSCM